MKFSPTLAFLLLSFYSFCQTPISGIINQYAKVLEINSCEGRLSLSGLVNPFAGGDQVLLIQMKGATINTSNSGSFGDIEDLGGAGLFEKNEVKSVNGMEVLLEYVISQSFDPGGLVQLISIPKFQDAVVTDTLTAAPWNGSTGGILALEVENTLSLNAPLDVSGKGFRGGNINIVASDCSFLTNADAYFYSTSNWRGSQKGEGVAEFLSGKEHGRGAQANGGGGGNDHNSGGGGGGSSSSAGGGGGKQKGPSTFGCTGDYPGRGGKVLGLQPNRIFLGGGGGAGHVDDNGAGSAGGNGGGTVIVLAKNIEANGHGIFANGASPTLANGDGAGGGGAGGSIFLQVENVQGGWIAQAKGGDGGDVVNEPSRCFGPGGGGGGGRLIASGNFAQASLSGGEPGINTIASGQCDGQSNGAMKGADGNSETVQQIPQSQMAYIPTAILAQPQPAIGCEGEQAIFEFLVQGNFLTYHWQLNTGNGWTGLTPGAGMTGINEPKLTITSINTSFDGYQFRCKVSSPCEMDFFSEIAALQVQSLPEPGFNFSFDGNGNVQFTNTSLNAQTYFWNFGNGTTSNEENPAHTYPSAGFFNVTLTASNECGQTIATQTISTGAFPQAAFEASVDGGCAPVVISFTSYSTGTDLSSFQWEFPGGNPSVSSQPNPVVTYNSPGIYDVKLTVGNAFGEDSLFKTGFITVLETPQVAFSFSSNGDTVWFLNESTGWTQLQWDFGDGTNSVESNPTHVYTSEGMFSVTLAASNVFCGSSLAQHISITSTQAYEINSFTWLKIYPNPAGSFLRIEGKEVPAEDTKFKVSDVHGKLKLAGNLKKTSTEISLEDWAAGLYLLEIETAAGKAVWRFLKK